jgi:glucose-1-phosphate thymidylyltransferase
MIAVILAAGYGTRMYPLTQDTPKALLRIGERTILGILLDKISASGADVCQTVVVSNHLFADAFRRWFADSAPPAPGSASSAPAWVVLDDGSTSEEDRLGSVGDLAFAIRTLRTREELLVLGSDNLFEDSLEGFVRFARERNAPTLGAAELPERAQARLYGVLSVDERQRIVRFAEKPKEPESSLVSTAVYFFPPGAPDLVLEYVSSVKAADTLGSFIAWLIARVPVYAYRFRGAWLDIGDLNSYQKAQESFQ